MFDDYEDESADAWLHFREVVQRRLSWLSKLAQSAKSATKSQGDPAVTPSRKVFVVHGHNEAVKESVARFLEKLQLEPVILHEQPNQGRTVIEKFVDYSDASFAVILLTPDDRGAASDQPFDAQKLRPRQNVVLELGFFLGKLGRSRVCTLYATGVELPSDYEGVVYLPLDDAGAWKMLLASEIKAAGIPFDMNDAV